MTPEQRLMAKWVAIFLFLAGIFTSGFLVRGYMANHELTQLKLDQQVQANKTLGQYADDLLGLTTRNRALQDKINTLDSKHTQVMNEQLAENARLRTDLGLAQRMRLQGASCPKAGTGSDPASTAGMGDGTGVELSEATRLAVWDLRESIIRDQAKLAYLQEERRTLSCSPQKSPE